MAFMLWLRGVGRLRLREQLYGGHRLGGFDVRHVTRYLLNRYMYGQKTGKSTYLIIGVIK